MPNFDDLKKQAELQVVQDKAAVQGWVKSHRGWLIAVGVALFSGFILAHMF